MHSTDHESKARPFMTHVARILVGLGILLSGAGCDPSDGGWDAEVPAASRSAVTPDPLMGLWTGLSPSNSSSPSLDHWTQISYQWVAHPTDPNGIYARYYYPNVTEGVVCHSELTLISSENGLHQFQDRTLNPARCVDGLVILEETANESELYFQWVSVDGTVDNEGIVSR